jgi:hypothetical protein
MNQTVEPLKPGTFGTWNPGTFGTFGTLEPWNPGTYLMPMTLAIAAVITLHRRLDQTHRIVGLPEQMVLTKAESALARSNRGELRRDAALGRDLRAVSAHVPLNRRTNQQPQLVVVHST